MTAGPQDATKHAAGVPGTASGPAAAEHLGETVDSVNTLDSAHGGRLVSGYAPLHPPEQAAAAPPRTRVPACAGPRACTECCAARAAARDGWKNMRTCRRPADGPELVIYRNAPYTRACVRHAGHTHTPLVHRCCRRPARRRGPEGASEPGLLRRALACRRAGHAVWADPRAAAAGLLSSPPLPRWSCAACAARSRLRSARRSRGWSCTGCLGFAATARVARAPAAPGSAAALSAASSPAAPAGGGCRKASARPCAGQPYPYSRDGAAL